MAVKEQRWAHGEGHALAGKMTVGDEHYLWLLVILEVFALIGLRHWSRRHHGG